MDNISEIKQRLSIVDVVSGYLDIKKAGNNYKGVCPFHNEDTPSFMVSPELQIFKCFGCGESGDIFTFVQKIEGVEFSRALEILAEKAGVEISTTYNDAESKNKKTIFEINHLTSEFYFSLLTKHKVGKRALKYFKEERKVTSKTISDFRLGYAPKTWDLLVRFLRKQGYSDKDMELAGVVTPKNRGKGYIDKFRGRVIFPFTDIRGRPVGFSGRTIFNLNPKYLNTAETPVFHKSDLLFGLDKAKLEIKKDGAIFVEGPMDVISAHQAGIKNVVASSGTSLTTNQLKIISHYTNDVTFCFDSDTAGILAIQRAIGLAEKQGFDIKIALIPDEYKDLDELLKVDVAKAKSMFSNAVPVYDFFLVAAYKKYDKQSSTGKKRIVEELVPVFSRIANKVVLSHYVDLLANEINIPESVLHSMFAQKKDIDSYHEFRNTEDASQKNESFAVSADFYLLALLFKSDKEIADAIFSDIRLGYFVEDRNKEVFENLKEAMLSSEDFNIESFIDRINLDLREYVQNIYLWDIGEELKENPKEFLRELRLATSRLKKEYTKRRLKELTERLKIAELEKDKDEIEKITRSIQKLTKELL